MAEFEFTDEQITVTAVEFEGRVRVQANACNGETDVTANFPAGYQPTLEEIRQWINTNRMTGE